MISAIETFATSSLRINKLEIKDWRDRWLTKQEKFEEQIDDKDEADVYESRDNEDEPDFDKFEYDDE